MADGLPGNAPRLGIEAFGVSIVMLIAAIKLMDLATRACFLLIVLYSLPSRESGQFGVALTLVGLFGFLSGFERYVDLQRDLVGKNAAGADRLILSTLAFFGLGYLLWLTPLAWLLCLWAKLDGIEVGPWLLIAVCEHLTSEVYRVSLIAPRYRWITLSSLGKNLLLLTTTIAMLFDATPGIEAASVVWLWALLALCSAVVSVVMFRAVAGSYSTVSGSGPALHIKTQFLRSRTHFTIGMLALATLQLDRLLAAALLSLEDSGIYFRHVFLAASAYQVFGILSHNRIMAKYYAATLGGAPAVGNAIIRRECRLYVVLSVAAIATALFVGFAGRRWIPTLEAIVPPYLATLMLAYMIRGIADYGSMTLNAAYQERAVFRSQFYTVIVGLVCGLTSTRLLGLAGLVLAALIGMSTYLYLIRASTSRLVAGGRTSS